jgi:Tfp pilus assembly protein PilV
MWSRQKTVDRRGRAGFVLFEVLVATVVAAILLAALMRAFAGVWSGIATIREDVEAAIVARAVVETAATSRSGLAARFQEGMSGSFRWTLAVAAARELSDPRAALASGMRREAGAPSDAMTGLPGGWRLYRITAAVYGPGGRRTVLETLRLGLAKR